MDRVAFARRMRAKLLLMVEGERGKGAGKSHTSTTNRTNKANEPPTNFTFLFEEDKLDSFLEHFIGLHRVIGRGVASNNCDAVQPVPRETQNAAPGAGHEGKLPLASFRKRPRPDEEDEDRFKFDPPPTTKPHPLPRIGFLTTEQGLVAPTQAFSFANGSLVTAPHGSNPAPFPPVGESLFPSTKPTTYTAIPTSYLLPVLLHDRQFQRTLMECLRRKVGRSSTDEVHLSCWVEALSEVANYSQWQNTQPPNAPPVGLVEGSELAVEDGQLCFEELVKLIRLTSSASAKDGVESGRTKHDERLNPVELLESRAYREGERSQKAAGAPVLSLAGLRDVFDRLTLKSTQANEGPSLKKAAVDSRSLPIDHPTWLVQQEVSYGLERARVGVLRGASIQGTRPWDVDDQRAGLNQENQRLGGDSEVAGLVDSRMKKKILEVIALGNAQHVGDDAEQAKDEPTTVPDLGDAKYPMKMQLHGAVLSVFGALECAESDNNRQDLPHSDQDWPWIPPRRDLLLEQFPRFAVVCWDGWKVLTEKAERVQGVVGGGGGSGKGMTGTGKRRNRR